ncbi:MAG: RluA family pseudouridine synthase [Fibrobacter sp.]|jgi:23S rRNA pseudouridine955/2504/2580 synthase|nr:RluA family pseudouridine synthase [Fibrobacter sp.]
MISKSINRHHANMRLDRYLRQEFPDETLSRLFGVIRKKKVRVNGVIAKAPLLLQEGDQVQIYESLKEKSKEPWGKAPQYCDALFLKNNLHLALEHEDFIVIDKSSGIASQPGTGTKAKETLVDMLWQWGQDARLDFKPTLVHRLDRETSGLLIAALHGDSLRKLAKIIREQKLQKYYFALVKGKLKRDKGVIALNLERSDSAQGSKVKVSDQGKPSFTRYKVHRRYLDCTLVKIKLETGRMHQIRAHFASIGHPLAGDSRYGDFEWNKKLSKQLNLNRLFLHSSQLEWTWKNQSIFIESPLPKELREIISQLNHKG